MIRPTSTDRSSKPIPNEESSRSFSIERQFGFMLAGLSSGFGGWWLYRGRHGVLSYFFIALGGGLAIVTIFLPAALVLPTRLWMSIAGLMSFVMTPVILAVVYFGLITPIAVVQRLIGRDPLRRRAEPSDSYWRVYRERQHDIHHYEKMY